MERHSGGGGPPAHLRGRPVSGLEAAHANEYFEPFLNAATLKNILGYHRAMCDLLHLRPNVFPHFYPKLRANLTSWRAKALWKKFDARASHKCYGKGKACAGLRVLVIGAGPCGLRTAIEAQLLGAKVVVVEKRDRLSRNNVLHLWPFVIEDLRMLGAKKFFGKFCAGAIDHISIRQLQCILLKVALLLGVEIHTEVSFEGLIEPSAAEKTGWRGQFKPEQHPVSQYEFDVIIGADGKRNTLQGFKRKEFRGKLAIAITANFINKKTEAEARVEEISGVAFIFNQKFFKELQEKTRIDLENIVYYKDDTHYFVMTAKKASLLEKGVIKQDLADTEKLLALANVDQERLHSYAREAADFSTNYKLPHLEFAVNHYGTPDVAMFDFTSMYAADYASKVVERNGTRLLMILVGDSLLEPFWPTGSGCARGFLSSLDAAWAIRSYCSGQMTPLDVLAERESIYRLLAQTTPDNLNKDWKAYTLDPATRYPNLNKRVVTPHQTVFLYDTDNPEGIDRMKRASLDYMGRPEHVAKKRRRGNVDSEVLLSWLSEQLKTHEEIEISDVKSVFENGRVLCALIHHYRPDLLDYGAIKEWEASRCNQLAMDVLEKELGLSPFMTGEEITRTNDYLVMTAYLTQVYDTFRGEIPHIKHPKLKKKAVLSKIPQKFSEKSPKSGCKDDSYPLTNKTGEKVVKKRPKVPKMAINPPLQTLSERTVLPRNVGSLKSVKKREFFDLTYNAEVPREHKPKKVSSRNVCLSVNLLEKKPPKPKKKLIKKAKLDAIPEKTEEKCPQNPELTPKKTLNVFHCHTFITTKDSFESLGFPDVPVRIPYQDTQNPLEIPSKTPLENKNSTSKPQLGLKRFSPLELIRKHLRIKKARIDEVLNKTEAPPAEPEVIEKTSSVCSSQETINIEIIHAGNDDITRQNVFYESSKRLVKITSRNFVSKETMTRKDDSFVLQKIFENGNFQNFSGSKGASSNGRLEARRFPGFKRKPLVESTPHLNKHQTAVKPSRHCQTCQIRENFQENNNRVYEGHSGDMPGNDGDKIAKRSKTMTFRETDGDIFSPQVYGRVQNWIRRHDFQEGDHEPNFDEPTALASCKTRSTEYDGVKVEQRTEVIKCMEENSSHEDLRDLVKPAKRASKLKIPKQRSRGSNVPKPVSKYSQFNLKSQSAPPVEFAVIMEGNEPELPENVTKPSEFSIKSIKTHQPPLFPITTGPPSRPSSRHKRHADLIQTKPGSLDRKQRKKRATLERTGPSVEERQKVLEEIACNRQDRQSRRKQQRQRQTEQFLKSMQMLQANCRPDDESSGPFEDYSIFLYRQTAPKFQDRVKDLEKQFTYVPDHESKLPGGPKPLTNTNAEEDIASKIKSLQDKWSNKHPTEKKPKDLMRAIGKIETSDWNIQQIEKKIIENKIGKPSTLNADKERVPRWSKEEFLARQTKMEKKHLDRQDSTEAKYADIDRNIKQLDLKLKEGMNRELGQNKVATITEKLVSKVPQEKEKPVEKPVPAKPVNIQSGSEFCHFCNKRVYLMERLSAEGRFFHHGCFKCQYCHSQLRLGSYMFDRDGQYGYRFFCIHHYGMQGELPRPTKLTRKPSQKGREVGQSPQNKPFGVTGVDLLDRVQTPERIEVSNLSSGNVSSDHEDHPSQMDEDEWTDKNFGQSCNELDESDDDDDSTSSVSDTDSDDEAAFDDALEQPVTKEGTMKWAERWKNSYRKGRGSDSDGYSSSDHSSYCENSSDESDSDTATEGEDEIRARELRKQEVRVDPPVVQTDTGTDTEVKKLSVDILPANLIISTPDILRLPLNKTPSGISLTTSDDVFNSAESDLDLNMNKTVASLPPVNPLSKSATAGNLIGAKPKRNFVLPPREQRKSFGQEFTPKYKLEEPLLVIKRTPSKVSMPKEIKPKVAVNTKKPIDTKKYFGAPRAPLKKAPLVKQSSLPETEKEILATVKPPINFEVKDSDFEDIDDYLEDLLKKEEELENPPPPEPEPDPSGSIEDLFSALEQETEPLEREQVKESEEKLQDLLKWMEELDHQEKNPEVTRKNDNIAFFETVMGPHRGLSRSKTEIRFNRPTRQPRTSVDLDAVKKVNIKSVLKKFESLDREDGPAKPAPERPLVKRFSLGSFNVDQARENLKKLPLVRPKPIANTIKKFEASKAVKKATKGGIEDPLEDLEKFVDETIGNIGKGARLGRSGSDWCVNVTVSSKVSPEFLRMQLESARENVPEHPRVNNEPVEVGSVSVDALETSVSLDVEASNPCQKNPEREDVSEPIKEEQNLPLEIPTLGNIEAQRSAEEREGNWEQIKGNSKEQVSEAPDPQESSEFDASNVQQISEKCLKNTPVISLDFSEELRQFDEAISALTDTSGSSDLLPPHNFSKAVQSSSSSSSLSSEYKKESNLPQDFAKAINSDSKEEEEEEKLPPQVPKRKKHLQPVCPRRHRSSTASPQPPRRRPEARRGSASDVEPPKAAQTGLKFPAKFGRKDKDKDCVIQ